MSTPESESLENNVVRGSAAGERLRLARETLKLSVKDVAEKIRIDVRKVEALEKGDVDAIGAPVFAAGYIRAYARIVALPADELISEFEGVGDISSTGAQMVSVDSAVDLGRMSGELPAAFSMSRRGRGKTSFIRWVFIALLLVVVAAAALWFLKSGRLAKVEKAGINSGEMKLPDETSSANESSGQTLLAIPGQDAYVPSPMPEAETDATSLPLSSRSDSDSDNDMPVSNAKETAKSATMVAADELILQFGDDSWVEVNDAQNNRLIHRLAHAGQIHTLHGIAPFSLVLGYVPGVRIILNGESVDLEKYRGRRLAHLTVGKDTVGEKTANEN